MGIFDRISAVLKSNINDLISRAEDPEKMLHQIIIDMRTDLSKSKQLVAGAIADEKRLKDQVDAEYKLAAEWEQRAMLAVKQGADDLAKQALMRNNEHQTHAQILEATWEAHRVQTESLKNSLRDLNDKIEEARRKKNLLLARQKRSEAQKRIAETMSSMSDKSAFEAFSRMESKIEDNERRVIANVEIDEEFSGDRLAKDFKALEKGAGAASAEAQLLALKQKMGLLGAGGAAPAKRIGAGGPGEETVHAEIEDAPGEKKKA